MSQIQQLLHINFDGQARFLNLLYLFAFFVFYCYLFLLNDEDGFNFYFHVLLEGDFL